jgi:FkbM family methyltransferase
MSFKSELIRLLGALGIGVTSQSNLVQLQDLASNQLTLQTKLELIQSLEDLMFSEIKVQEVAKILEKSTSQLGQDIVALIFSGYKEEGFFVEFGATNGKDLSNTHMLEKDFGWNGILAEPARMWHKDLKANRSCHIDTDCVWKESNQQVAFNEVLSGELSTIDSFSNSDMHTNSRKSGKMYMVDTVSLNDLLNKYDAPNCIDYLSIDTEGSEYEILNELDFNKYRFNFITCEHNFTSNRSLIHDLLVTNGYIRKLSNLSKFDDWFVHQSLLKA